MGLRAVRKIIIAVIALLLCYPASAQKFCCWLQPPLLNTLSVPATVAYSTRKLNSAYAGSAIRVRRQSDSTQLDIGFVGGQLDTVALTNFCTSASANCFINTWYDQSGNGINAIAGNGPIIAASAVVTTLNGHPATRFGLSSAVNNMQATLSISQPLSIVVAGQYSSLLVNGDYSDGTTGTPRTLVGVSGSPVTAWQLYAGGTALTGGTPDLLSHALIGIFNGASSSLVIDGATILSGNPGSNGITTLAMGAANGGGGAISSDSWVGDFIIFSSALGATDQATIRASMKSQWGTQ